MYIEGNTFKIGNINSVPRNNKKPIHTVGVVGDIVIDNR